MMGNNGKVELRKLIHEKALQQTPEQLSLWNDRILRELEESAEFKNARRILIYVSIEGEVPTYDFVKKWRQEKEFVLPKVVSESVMQLRKYIPGHLISGAFSILEPDESCDEVPPELLNLAIIPGLAFAPVSATKQDNVLARGNTSNCETSDGGKFLRLGRGKGYYDRLITKLNCPTIGICYPYNIVQNIPHDEWDQSVDKCIF